jgi:hypothetical protein
MVRFGTLTIVVSSIGKSGQTGMPNNARFLRIFPLKYRSINYSLWN